MAVDLIDLHGKSAARLSKARPPNEAASHGAIDYFSTSTTKRVVVFCALSRSASKAFQAGDLKNATASSTLSHSTMPTLDGAGPSMGTTRPRSVKSDLPRLSQWPCG